MRDAPLHHGQFRRTFVLWLVIGTTVAFLYMVRHFVLAVVVAALLAGTLYPMHGRWTARLGGRPTVAAAGLTAATLVIVGIPALGVIAFVVGEALVVTRRAEAWVSQHATEDGLDYEAIEAAIPSIGGYTVELEPLLAKAGELVGTVGGFVVASVTQVTALTASFFLDAFVLFYALFFFLVQGRDIVRRTLSMFPLEVAEEAELVTRVLAITRATVKGTLVIGVVQGTIAGVAMWIAGIKTPVFWGAIMSVLSVIPGIGPALVWIPASLLLVVWGDVGAGVGLFVFCSAVVGTIDNVMRPRLVGQDAQMSDLTILVSTIGGIGLFGPVGLVLGPILAGVWSVVVDMYGSEFAERLGTEAPTPD